MSIPVTTTKLSEIEAVPSVRETHPDGKAFAKLEKKMFHSIGKAIGDFKMIDEGDQIMVAVSGGKDSWVMLHILEELRKRAPVKFNLIAVNIDQGYAGFRQDKIEDYLVSHGFKFHMEFFNIAQILEEKNKDGAVPCSLCSRLRRGSLSGLAAKLGCNKIALGHHQDDMIETLLLNTFFNGRLAAMAPKLVSEDEKITVIRPLMSVSEKEIIQYAEALKFPIVCCQCPLMCGEASHLDHRRRKMKDLLKQLEKDIPEIKNSILASLGRVQVSHLMDLRHFDFSKNFRTGIIQNTSFTDPTESN